MPPTEYPSNSSGGLQLSAAANAMADKSAEVLSKVDSSPSPHPGGTDIPVCHRGEAPRISIPTPRSAFLHSATDLTARQTLRQRNADQISRHRRLPPLLHRDPAALRLRRGDRAGQELDRCRSPGRRALAQNQRNPGQIDPIPVAPAYRAQAVPASRRRKLRSRDRPPAPPAVPSGSSNPEQPSNNS